MRQLALSLRGIRTRDVTFVTIPLERYARINGQSVNLVNRSDLNDLFAAAKADDLENYVKTSGDPVLPDPGQVN